MTVKELSQYTERSVQITYTNKIAQQIRTGYVFAVSAKFVIFYPFEHDDEVHIPIKSIDNIEYL